MINLLANGLQSVFLTVHTGQFSPQTLNRKNRRFTEDKLISNLNSLAKESKADLAVIEDFRSEYAKYALFSFRIQSEVTGKLYKKTKN